MGWLEDALAGIAASGEGAQSFAPPAKTERERELESWIAAQGLTGSYPGPDASGPGIRYALGDGPAPVSSGKPFVPAPFSMAGDPMTAGGPYPLGVDPMTAGGIPSNGPGLPFARGTDPMVAGGGVANGPGLPFRPAEDPVAAGGPVANGPAGDMAMAQLAKRLGLANPALSFPTSQPMEKYTDFSSGWPQEATRPVAKFGDIPLPAPAAIPGMPPQSAIAGLNSPLGGASGGGAPFSIAGPPSLGAAKAMTAPPPAPMAPQAPIANLVPPGAAPGAPALATPPVVAQDDGENTPAAKPTDVSARGRAPVAAPVAVPAAVPAPVARPSIMDSIKGLSPDLIALGAGLSGHGWGASQELASGRAKKEEADLLRLQQGNVTARLLASKGATPQEIAAAITGGPDVMKALVGQYLGKDKFKVVQTGETDRGRKTFQLLNEQDGTFKEIPGATVQADNASDAAAAAGITGDSFLKTVPNAQDRSLIKQLTQYDLDPGKLSAKGGNRERLLALAEQYDPDYKAVLYAPRAAALKEFLSGGQTSPASIMTNGNTAIQHLGRMSELADKLGGTNKGWILNGAINWANITAEEWKNNPDLARFKGAQDRFVEEATKFYRGVGGNKSDIDRALSIQTAAQSPQARQAAIQEQAELMQSKVNALQDRFKSAMGPSGWKRALEQAGNEFPIVQQKSAEELEKIRKRAAGEKVDSAKPVKPGNYVYRNGALVPE